VTDETDYFRLADHPRSKRTPKPRAIAGGGRKRGGAPVFYRRSRSAFGGPDAFHLRQL
jgi:hypothetical protein